MNEYTWEQIKVSIQGLPVLERRPYDECPRCGEFKVTQRKEKCPRTNPKIHGKDAQPTRWVYSEVACKNCHHTVTPREELETKVEVIDDDWPDDEELERIKEKHYETLET